MTTLVQQPKPANSLADLLGVLLKHTESDLHLQAGEVPIEQLAEQASLNPRHREQEQARARHSRQFAGF